MSDSDPAQRPLDPAGDDAPAASATATALGGVAVCLFALQFTLVGLLSGSSLLPLLVGLGLGGAGVYRALDV